MDKSLILNKIKEHLNIRYDKELADFLGIKTTTLAMWHTRNTYDTELLFNKCEFLNSEWLLTGNGSMLKTPQSLDYNETNYKELAISRLETIESNHKMICLLEDKIVALNNTIANLKGPSVQKGAVEFLDEPSLKQLSGK
jgi:hypothetical protein